jgi:hypothetical protein
VYTCKYLRDLTVHVLEEESNGLLIREVELRDAGRRGPHALQLAGLLGVLHQRDGHEFVAGGAAGAAAVSTAAGVLLLGLVLLLVLLALQGQQLAHHDLTHAAARPGHHHA